MYAIKFDLPNSLVSHRITNNSPSRVADWCSNNRDRGIDILKCEKLRTEAKMARRSGMKITRSEESTFDR